jgi:uncharacterized protein
MQQKAEVIRVFVGGPNDANEDGQRVVESIRSKLQTELGSDFSIVVNNWKDEHNPIFLGIDDQQGSINERFDVRHADIVLMLFRGSLGSAKVAGSDAPSASAWELEQAAEAGRARAIGIVQLHLDDPQPQAPPSTYSANAHRAHNERYEEWAEGRRKFAELEKYITEFCDKWVGRGRNISVVPDLKSNAPQAAGDFVRRLLKPQATSVRRRNPYLDFEGAPYCGLYEFTFDHRDAYFGRAAEVSDLVEKFDGRNGVRLLLVHGASGVGKSSLIQAGLLKAFEPPDEPDFNLTFLVFEPAGHSRKPFIELAKAIKKIVKDKIKADEEELGSELRQIFVGLPRDESAIGQRIEAAARFEARISSRLSRTSRQAFIPIVINQLEKIYDVAEAERAPFFNFIACAPYFQNLRLIGSIRQDAYDRLVQEEQHVNATLGEGQRGSYTLRPPLPRQLREMILEPWRLIYGEPDAEFLDLVEEILSDALKAGEAALPLISQTLFVLHNQYREKMTRTAYEALGRLEGVISKVAEEQKADPVQLKRLFKPLSTLRGGRWTNQIARKETLVAAGVDATLIEKLAGDRVRLLHIGTDARGEAIVHLAHEILFTAWPALVEYTKEAHLLESERVAVIDDARQWHKNGQRSRDLKLRGESYHQMMARLQAMPDLFDGPDRDVTESYFAAAWKVELRERLVAAVNGGWLGALVDILREGGALELEDRGGELHQLRPQFWAAVTGNDYDAPDPRKWKTQQCPAPEVQSLFVKDRRLVLSAATRGMSVAHIAAASGQLDLLKRLVALNPEVTKSKTEGGSDLVVSAAIGGDLRTVKYLVDDLKLPFDEEDDEQGRPIIWAVQKAHKKVLAYLRERGARSEVMTQQGFNTLTEAASSGDGDEVRAALDNGFAIDGQTKDGQTALMVAARASRQDIVHFLLSKNADSALKTIGGLTALHMATYQEREEPAIIRLLITNGVDRNAKDNDGDTPLHLAAAFGRALLVRELLDCGVERDPVNNSNQTPLHVAANSGYAEVVWELLRGGGDVAKAEQNGWTALHYAAADGDQTTLRELLNHPPTGEIINRRARDGWTALMLASGQGHAAIVRSLIDQGADRQLLLRDGRDALAMAIKSLSAATVREFFAPLSKSLPQLRTSEEL